MAIAVFDGRQTEPHLHEVCGGIAASFTTRCPGKTGPNEDALAVIDGGDGRSVLAIADGFGGQPAGDQASRCAIEAIIAAVSECVERKAELREGILNGFEAANSAIVALGVGAATTLAVAEIDNGSVRPYHVGDSEILIVGQRGRRRLQTLSHSPVGYGVEAGLIDRDDAMHHEERNIVSNMVGSPEMRIDVGPRIVLHARDTLLLGTDGVFDNLGIDDITEIIRKGPLDRACARLVETCVERMVAPEPTAPSKPDDIAVITFRCG